MFWWMVVVNINVNYDVNCFLYFLEYVVELENVFFNRKINQEDGGARFYWMFSNVKFQYQKFLSTQIELGEEIVPCQCRCPF